MDKDVIICSQMGVRGPLNSPQGGRQKQATRTRLHGLCRTCVIVRVHGPEYASLVPPRPCLASLFRGSRSTAPLGSSFASWRSASSIRRARLLDQTPQTRSICHAIKSFPVCSAKSSTKHSISQRCGNTAQGPALQANALFSMHNQQLSPFASASVTSDAQAKQKPIDSPSLPRPSS